MNDKANEYNSYKEVIEELIKKITCVGIENTYYKEQLKIVDDDITLRIKEINMNDDFMKNAMELIYADGIKKLSILNDKLSKEYDTYYKIDVTYKKIRNYLENFEIEKLSKYIDMGVELLSMIEKSSTMDFKNEEALLRNSYDVIYKLLLVESIYSKNELLLNMIEKYPSHTNRINTILSRKLDEIENELISEIKYRKIKENGINYNLLDKEIIALIASKDENIKKYFDDDKRFLKEYSKKIDENLESVVCNIKNSEENIKDKKEHFKKAKKAIKLLRLRGSIFLLVAFGVFFGGEKLARGLSTKRVYKVHDIETNLETEEVTENPLVDDYVMKNVSYQADITEYSPWIERSLKPKYYRIINNYVYENPVKDKLNYNILALYNAPEEVLEENVENEVLKINDGVKINTPIIETKDVLDSSDETKKTTTILHEIYQDKKDYKDIVNIDEYIILLSSLGTLDLITLLYCILYNENAKTSKSYSSKEYRENLEFQKQFLLEHKEQYNTLLKDLKNYISSMENIPAYDEKDKENMRLLLKKYEDIQE